MDVGAASLGPTLSRLQLADDPCDLRRLHGHTALARRMVVSSVLTGHQGCVNRLAFSSDATLILSGSDDCTLRIWSVDSPTDVSPRAVVTPSHMGNIFGVAFMPDTGNQFVASTGLDEQVRHTNVETSSSTLWTCHNKTVKSLAPFSSSVFVTASRDGFVRMFDVRESPFKLPPIVVRVPDKHDRFVPLSSAMPSPTCTHHLVVAAEDPFVRIFDLRIQGPLPASNEIERFCPPHLHTTSPEQYAYRSPFHRPSLTYANFSSDGNQVVASYFEDVVAVFNRSHPNSPVINSPPSLSTSARAVFICNALGDAAKFLIDKNPTAAVAAASRALAFDPTNVRALFYRADACFSRGGAGDFRAAYATLHTLIDILKQDSSRVLQLWGSDGPLSPPGFPAEGVSQAESAEMWTVVLQYMQTRCLYRTVPPVHVIINLKRNAHERVLTMKRLQYIDDLCHSLEQHCQKKVSQLHHFQGSWPSYVRRCALGEKMGAAALNQSKSAKARAGILARPVEMYLSGVSGLRDHLSQSMTCLSESGPRRSGTSRFMYACTNDTVVVFSPELDDDMDDSTVGDVGDDISDVDDQASGVKTPAEIWGPLDLQSNCKTYAGHISEKTEIKEANFFGSRDQIILSGSDNGSVIMWCAATGEILNTVEADELIVNCVLPHPYHNMVIASGIDDTIKVLTPQSVE